MESQFEGVKPVPDLDCSLPPAGSDRRAFVMRSALAAAIAALTGRPIAAFAQTPTNGRRVHRLLIHNATVVDGNGTPASGPKDILIENNLIADVIPLDPVAAARACPICGADRLVVIAELPAPEPVGVGATPTWRGPTFDTS